MPNKEPLVLILGKKYTERVGIARTKSLRMGPGKNMHKLKVSDFVEQVKHYSNMPLDISIVMEPFGLFVESYDFEGVLLGIFLEDLLDQ
ncbi:hypothetical protein N9W79_02205, partial [bacterium]|nr:hypothetical protein [bacterium]